jgi:hypothetical protein
MRLKNLINFNSFSNYKKLSTYNESKHENKENVSNSDHGETKADSTYMEKLVNQFKTPFTLLTIIY